MNTRTSIISLVMLITGLILDYLISTAWFTGTFRLTWYLAAYIPVGLPVLRQGWAHLQKGDFFTEFFLMGIATIGAFAIGEYPEGVAVMLFYSIGEEFQHRAVHRARRNIQSLLDLRPVTARVKRKGGVVTVHPEKVEEGEVIQVRPGEGVPLDGRLLEERTTFDTSALTGESRPRYVEEGEKVLAGMINETRVVEIEVIGSFENSYISRILKMVQEASSRKAKTERFIRSFARIYTPAVVGLAALLVFLPALFVASYSFGEWLYRGLVFLVISCPCALVISIPLGYFGGVGAASRHGILVKGATFLDALTSVRTVVFDKTGTLTRGTFEVQKVEFKNQKEENLLPILLAVEKNSTHPVARAITDYAGERVQSLPVPASVSAPVVESQSEIPGYGIGARVDGKQVWIGNWKLMEKERVALNGFGMDESGLWAGEHSHGSSENGGESYGADEKGYSKNGDGDGHESVQSERGTGVFVAVDGVLEGILIISDEIREDSARVADELRALGVLRTAMLTGDRRKEAKQVGAELRIDQVHAELLPHEKADKVEEMKQQYPGTLVYAGDGINDAPVLAVSDVGIAMGAMGSDVAVESADVVIQTDQPSKIATAIRIGRATRTIVWQNITMAMGIKLLVLAAGAAGAASLWGAVFADVGVALLAILNAVRIQRMKFL